MKKRFRSSTNLLRFALLPALAPAASSAQQIDFLTPTWVGNAGITQEYSQWDVFYAAPGAPRNSGFRTTYQWSMYPDLAAPNETSGIYADPEQNGYEYFAHASNPSIKQVGNPNAWVLSRGNIYSPALPVLEFEIADQTPFIAGTVMLQFVSLGQFPDFASCELRYTDGAGTPVAVKPVLQQAVQLGDAGGTFGGAALLYAYQWDLAGRGVSTYRIHLAMSDSSVSATDVILDTASSFVPQLPESTFLTWVVNSFPWDEITPTGDAAPESDADGDGLNSVAEYALGRDPYVWDAGIFETGIASHSGGNRLFLRYERPTSRKFDPDLVLGARHCFDLQSGSWSLRPDDPAPVAIGGGWERVTIWSPYRVGDAQVPGGSEFLSFRASLAP